MLNKINLETDPNNKEISNLTYATKECTNKKDSFCKIFKDKSYKKYYFFRDSMVQQLIPNFDNRNLNINIYDLSYSGMIYLKNYERVIANKITAGQEHHDNRINLINSLENKTIIFFGRYSYIANNNHDYRKNK